MIMRPGFYGNENGEPQGFFEDCRSGGCIGDYHRSRLEARPSLAPARRARVLIYSVLPIMSVHDSGPGMW